MSGSAHVVDQLVRAQRHGERLLEIAIDVGGEDAAGPRDDAELGIPEALGQSACLESVRPPAKSPRAIPHIERAANA